jgi:putative drug exporter of the RND superfamily
VLERLADLAARRARLVLVLSFVFLGLAGALGGPVAGLLASGSEGFQDSSYESVRAQDRLEAAAGSDPNVGLVVLVRTDGAPRSPELRRRIESIAATVSRDPVVAEVFTGYNVEADRDAFFSRDGRASYVAVAFEPIDSDEAKDAGARIADQLEDEPGVTVGGQAIADIELEEQTTSDLAKAEGIAFPLLLILSLFVFRGLVAALLPLVAGVFSIVGTFLALRIVNEITPLSIFAVNMVTGLGLGLAIDYSLFVVSRYREELARVGPGREALVRTLGTAGRTVAFSALTVAAAMASLLVFPQQFLYSMGAGGIMVAFVAAGAALIVLPAILAVLGKRVNSLAPARWRRATERSGEIDREGFWYRLSHFVMARAALVAAATAALLITLGIPFLQIRFTGVDAGSLPEQTDARQVHEVLENEFPPNRTSPIQLAIAAPRSAGGDLVAYAGALRQLPNVATVRGPQPIGERTWRIDVITEQDPLADDTRALVRDIRELPPVDVLAGGVAADFIDLQDSLRSRLPLALAVLTLTTLLLLFVMTGSVILPFKTLLMNLLTVLATFGLLVLIFQEGYGESVLRFTSEDALNATQPILIAAVAFALSTDYGVFLLTRIKEARESGLDDNEAVAFGLERTGRIVTAAALMFCVAIGAFATSDILLLKQLGVGMALAVLIDATLVRALLVPSLMRLLGRWNWWAPAPLRRFHDRYGLHETADAPGS